jgi:hypothetical protein
MTTFAAIHAKNQIDINSCDYFYGYTIAAYIKDTRLSNPCRLQHLCRNDSWRNMGGDSLSYLYYNFHRQMPRINENQSVAKHSTSTLTPTGATSVQVIHQHIFEHRVVLPETPTGLIGLKVRYTQKYLDKLKRPPTLQLPECGYFIITDARFENWVDRPRVSITVSGGSGYPYIHYQKICYDFDILCFEPVYLKNTSHEK